MNRTVRRSDKVVGAPLDDTFLMMNLDKGKHHSLNDVGARIWELLDQPTTEENLVRAMLVEYDIDPKTCAEQVSAFLDALRQRDLLIDLV